MVEQEFGSKEQKCLFDIYREKSGDKSNKPLMISCKCKKCNPFNL